MDKFGNAEVGDTIEIVEVIHGSIPLTYKIGERFKVISKGGVQNGTVKIKEHSGVIIKEEYIVVEEETTIQPTKIVQQYEYNAGDKLICLSNPYNEEGYVIGDVYEVTSITTYGDEVVYGVIDKDGNRLYSTIDKFVLSEVESEDSKVTAKTFLSVYEYRKKGIEVCKTDGSEHYIGNLDEIEPIEYAIQNDFVEDFSIVNIVKYATRFKKTRNANDLKKVADYAHILAGIEVLKEKGVE